MTCILPNWELILSKYGVLVPKEAPHWRNVIEEAFEESGSYTIGTVFWNQILPEFLAKHNAEYIDKLGEHINWPDNDSALRFKTKEDMMLFLLKFA